MLLINIFVVSDVIPSWVCAENSISVTEDHEAQHDFPVRNFLSLLMRFAMGNCFQNLGNDKKLLYNQLLQKLMLFLY